MSRKIALGALALYVGAIVLANYLIVHGMPGATATPFHTYTLPTLFGLVCPAGTYMAAVSFPLRDVVQRAGGAWLGIAAIVLAAVVSWWVSSPIIAIASGGTFLISESLEPVGRDHLSERITMRRGLTGAKPERFCRWVLDLLGYQPGDELEDLFPGTGVMARVVNGWNEQLALA
jgi:hypothetical protein